MEIWKPIKGYEKYYEVSTLGRVRSLDRICRNGVRKSGKILKPNVLKDGYSQIALIVDCEKKYEKVHRLVALAFIDNPQNKPQVNHKNGIRHDNRMENLEWVTISENHRHAFDVLGKKPTKYWTGKKSVNRKLTKEQIADIILDNRSQSVIAEEYGVVQQTISNIKTGKYYVSW